MKVEFKSEEWNLIQATASRIIEQESKTGFETLPEEERVFFLVWISDGEVGNGGMEAVCYNSTGDYLKFIPKAFAAIGAPKKGELFADLWRVFGGDGPSPGLERRNQQLNSFPQSACSKIEKLTQAYFDLDDREEVSGLLYSWCVPWAGARLKN